MESSAEVAGGTRGTSVSVVACLGFLDERLVEDGLLSLDGDSKGLA